MSGQNNEINSPLPTSIVNGGTAATLTASNGGILYSTATTGALLSGTATQNQMLQSGASGAPSWSTATYPATTVVNRILRSSSNNVVTPLGTTNSAVLVTSNSGVPSWSSTMTNGQVIIGNVTTGLPAAATLTAGTNVTITNGTGTITVNASAGGTGNYDFIASQTASSSAALSFNSQLSSTYFAYQIVLINILPATAGAQLWLQVGTGAGPTWVTTGYLYQLCDINNNGSNLAYPGYNATTFGESLLTYANNNGISGSSTYGGVCGMIDLFVQSGTSVIGSGVSHMSYMSNTLAVNYSNTTSSFQTSSGNFTSVRLLMSSGNIASGTAYLYGLT